MAAKLPPITFKEEDGDPSVTQPWEVRFTDGSLTANPDGSVSIDLSAGTTGASGVATYIIQTNNAGLANAQVLAELSAGLLKVTPVTGVISTASANVDYLTALSASSPLVLVADTLSIGKADTDNPGFLSDTDWDTFNNKWAVQTTGAVSAGDNITVTGSRYALEGALVIALNSAIQVDSATITTQLKMGNYLFPSSAGAAGQLMLVSGSALAFADTAIAGWAVQTTALVSATSPITVPANVYAFENELVISIDSAASGVSGYLTAADWGSFDEKQAALTFNAPLAEDGDVISLNSSIAISTMQSTVIVSGTASSTFPLHIEGSAFLSNPLKIKDYVLPAGVGNDGQRVVLSGSSLVFIDTSVAGVAVASGHQMVFTAYSDGSWTGDDVVIGATPNDSPITITQIDLETSGSSGVLDFNIEARPFGGLGVTGSNVFAAVVSANAAGANYVIADMQSNNIASSNYLVMHVSAEGIGRTDFYGGVIYYNRDTL